MADKYFERQDALNKQRREAVKWEARLSVCPAVGAKKRSLKRESSDGLTFSEALLTESDFRIVYCSNGNVDDIFTQLNVSEIVQIAVT
jgi:hypothetical protein